MAITTVAFYLTTGAEIDVNWSDVSDDRMASDASDLLLPSLYWRADFGTDRAELQAAIAYREVLVEPIRKRWNVTASRLDFGN